MKKSLIALAALAATGAFAQSSVTISGFLNGSYDMFSVSGNATRAGNKSENRVSDNATRIIFNTTEDLGGGLRAIGQLDLRPVLDQSARLNAATAAGAAPNPTPTPLAGGNSHIGLSSNTMGTIRLGRQDLHYVENGNFAPASNATIQSHAGLMVTANGTFVGRTSRTGNLVWYTSPTVAGLTATLGYSTNGYSGSGTTDAENDMASGQRKGSTMYGRLGYGSGPLTAVVSYINEKSDYTGTAVTTGVTDAAGVSSANAQADRKGTMITAKYDLGMARVGFAWADNRSTVVSTGVASKRTNWQAGLGIPMGANNFALTYTSVGDVAVDGRTTANSGATAIALAYAYDFSKRTQLFAGYNRLSNKSAGQHGLFYNSDNAVGSIGSSALAGERHSAFSLGLRHAF